MRNRRFYQYSAAAVMALSIAFPAIAESVTEEDTTETNSKAIPLEDVQRFSNAVGEIKKYYVKPTADKELFDNAIRGMLSGLDPHSSYLDEASFKDLQTSTSGEFGGLGIEVTMEDGIVKVVTPLIDTPAFKAGIKPGDYIIKLGSLSVQGMSLQDAVSIMRGKLGTTIELTILRKGAKEPLKFTLVREKILIKSVKSKLLDKKYGYVQLSQFQALTGKDMGIAIEKLKKESGGTLQGLILDLRNNPGGLLDSAIQVSDAFLSHDKNGKGEVIVYTQGRLPGSKFIAMSNPGDILNNAPLVVLINNGSASASEIVAGALKDNKRAIILGTQSFGKGSVQTVLPLDDTHAIKLTTALYYTPSGTSIQAKGISPDIVIEDVKMAEANKNADKLGYSEADLTGHIVNQNPGTEEVVDKKTAEQTPDLMRDDYQLYAALTILKGLAVAKR